MVCIPSAILLIFKLSLRISTYLPVLERDFALSSYSAKRRPPGYFCS